MLTNRKLVADETQYLMTDGGLLTLSQGPIQHLHYQNDEEIQVFGLAVASDFNIDRDNAHILEHLVMRQQVGGGELPRVLELNSSTRWWSAYTSSRCISFEVSGYTRRCLEKSSALLCKALFKMQVTEDNYASEANEQTGRLTTEEQAHEGNLRLRLLVDIANKYSGTNYSYQSAIPSIEGLQDWYSRKVHPATTLWFTSGSEDYSTAHNMVLGLADDYLGMPQFSGSSPVLPSNGAPFENKSYPGTVLAWQGPSPIDCYYDFVSMRTIHSTLMRQNKLYSFLADHGSTQLCPQTSTVLSDLDASFFTLGLKSDITQTLKECLPELLQSLTAESSLEAESVLSSWLVRRLKYYPGRRPKGSRVFAELREAAQAGADLHYLARPDLLAKEVLSDIKGGLCHKLINKVYSGDSICLR